MARVCGTRGSRLMRHLWRRICPGSQATMIRGIYTTAAGLATAQLRLGVVSNNIANMQTPGYKQDQLPEDVGKAIDLQRFATNPQGQAIGSITLGPQEIGRASCRERG